MHIMAFIFFTAVSAEVYEGNVLFTPVDGDDSELTTILMDNDFNLVHSWEHGNRPSSMPYLLPDSSIVYPYKMAL